MEIDDLIKKFKEYLKEQELGKVSVKNYAADVRGFLRWAKKVASSKKRKELDSILFSTYRSHLLSAKTPRSSVNRKLSSLRKFGQFLKDEKILMENPARGISNIPKAEIPRILNNFAHYLSKQRLSPISRKNYLSDIANFLAWVKKTTKWNLSDLPAESISQVIIEYKKRLLKYTTLSKRTINRKLSSLRRFADWAEKTNLIATDPFKKKPKIRAIPKKVWAPLKVSLKGLPIYKKLAHYLRYTRPSWYKKYHELEVTHYFHWAILVIFCAALGFGIYDQVIRRARPAPAYPTALKPPSRHLSFQGRLTDSSGTPFTEPINIYFTLFSDETLGTRADCSPSPSGYCLWDSGQCSIDPDQDGIFSTILGSTCGTELTNDVFSENVGVWLEIMVVDETLSPRQQIATVAYALNAETLQGYPPDETAEANTVPVLDSSGNLVIAAASPTIQATSGDFAIEGKTGLKLQTATASDADISIDPNGTGKLNIYLGGATGNQMRITDVNITDDALVSVYAGTPDTGFDLLNLSSGSTETTVFSVDESGHTYVAGNLGIGTTNPGAALDVGGGSSQLADGPDDVLIKGDLEVDDDVRIDGGEITTSVATTWDLADSATSLNIESGLLNLDTQSSYVGIGTTGPSQKLHIAGNMRLTGAFHDVNDESGSSSQILSSTGSGTDWVDITSVGVGGSGTINYIPKFTASTTLGNSLLYDDGTNVGIGNTNPTAKLDITGTLKASSTITFSVLATNGPVYTTAGGALNSEQYLSVSRGGTGLDGSSASNGQLLIGSGSGYTLNTLTAGVGIGITNASGSITIDHEDTSNQESSDNSDLTFIQDITLDTFGHLTGLDTNTITASNGLTATGLDIELGGSLEKTTTITQGIYDMIFNLSDTGDFRVQDNGADVFFVKDDGNIGIGTTAPGALLHVGSAGSPGTVDGIDDLYVYNDLEVDGTLYGDGSGLSGVTATATPGGNDGDIQYNKGGVMGGASGFYWDDGNSYVGIGTTNPLQKLQVAGDINVESESGFRINNAATSEHYLRGNGTRFVSSAIQPGDLPGDFSGFANPTATIGLTAVNGSATTAMRSDAAPALSQAITPTWTGQHTFTANSYFPGSGIWNTSGNVGIGTTGPGAYKLNVQGKIYALTQGAAAGEVITAGRTLTAGSGLTGGGDLTTNKTFDVGAGTDISVAADAVNNTSTLATVTGRGASTTTQLAFNYNSGSPFTVLNSTVVTNLNADLLDGQHGSYYLPITHVSGTTNYVAKFTDTNSVGNSIIYDSGTNVGIGTTNPRRKLEIYGNLLVAGGNIYDLDDLVRIGLGDTVTVSGNLQVNVNDLFVEQSTGRVGIGTAGPQSLLHVATAATGGSGNAEVRIQAQNTGNDRGAILNFLTSGIGGSLHSGDNKAVIKWDGTLDTSEPWGLDFQNSSGTSVLAIENGGSVGIGTAGPSTRLHVDETTGYSQAISGDKILSLVTGGNTANTQYTFAIGYSLGLSSAAAVSLNTYYDVKAGTAAGEKEGGIQLIYRRNDNASAIAGGKIAIRKESGSNLSSIRFFTNDTTEKVTIDTNGNVGIGTASPGDKLDVEGDIRLNDNKLALRTGSDDNHYIQFASGVNGPRIAGYLGIEFYKTNGSVQLGTWDSTKLYVNGNVDVAGTLYFDAANADGNIDMDTFRIEDLGDPNSGDDAMDRDYADGRYLFEDSSDVWNDDGSADYLRFEGDTDANLLYIDGTNSRIGIGTASPLSALHVGGNEGITWGASPTQSHGLVTIGTPGSYGSLFIHMGGHSSRWNSGLGISGTYASNFTTINIAGYGVKSGGEGGYGTHLAFSTSASTTLTEQMRITSGGYVGIGTASPEQKLHVGESGSNRIYVESQSGSDTGFGLLEGGSMRWLLDNRASDDKFAIRSETGTYPNRLSVLQNGNIYFNSGIGERGSQWHQLHIDASTWEVFRYSSRRELKREIIDLEIDTSKIYDLRPVSFTPIENLNARDFGLIAEEVAEVLPDLALYVDGKPDGVKYAGLPVLILNEMIKQKPLIDTLKSDFALTETGDIVIENLNSDLPAEQSLESQISNLKSQIYNLKLKTGEIVERIANFAEVASARIKAGLIETTNLIAENVVVEEKIISPLAEVQEVKTDLISPLSEGGDMTIKLAQDDTGSKETYDPVSNKSKFKIINEQEIEVASIDAEGNATFSGTVKAEEVHAKKIVADEIEGLEARIANLTAETIINNYYYEEATEEDAVPPSEEGLPEEATESALLAQLEEEIDQILNTEYSPLDSTNLDVDSGIFNEFLAVLGQASIVNLEVTNTLVVNNTMQITNNSIGVVGDDSALYIQPAGIGIINMMAGKFVIDEKGNVTIEGNLAVKGSLFANEIRPESEDLVINLAQEATESGFGQLLVKGVNEEIVASIDSSGNLTASGSATFKKLNIATAESTSSGTLMHPAITTNATTGTATLPAGSTEFTVYNEQVTNQSLIYITPISETQNKVLYVKAKNGGDGWFKVAIDAPIDNEVKFNWWIIN